MAKTAERLNAKQVDNFKGPGVLHDGRGLYLHVGQRKTATGTAASGKNWLLRYQIDGKARWMGLGSYPEIGLARAREKASQARSLKAEGIDPLTDKAAQRAQTKAEAAKIAAKAITFKACAEKFIAAHQAGWRNSKHCAQWTSTLSAYANPVIGHLPAAAVETGHVTQILGPIWTTKPETASRVRGRIEAVLDFAKTHGWRTGENPARWKGHLENVLPPLGKVRKVEHHHALPWREIDGFMAELAKQEGVGTLALRFAILTAARTGEVIGARWREIDMGNAVWTVPPERMKAAREHRVPLSDTALDVLREAAELGPDGFVFPGQRGGAPLSNMALLMTLRRMKRADLTAHGFRSTFRTWCSETGKPTDIAEAALAHTQGKLHDAYQRGDLLERRRKLMSQWANFCSCPARATGEVMHLHERQAAG